MDQLSVGDWVKGPTKGFFRVEKIVPRYVQEFDDASLVGALSIGDQLSDSFVILKRCFNSKYKRSISWESCSASLCQRVGRDESERISALFNKTPKILQQFNEYEIPVHEQVTMFFLNFANKAQEKKLVEEVFPFIKEGRTCQEVEDRMGMLELTDCISQQFPVDFCLVLVNYGFEKNENNQLVFRNVRFEKMP
jgi:hypothetical protein